MAFNNGFPMTYPQMYPPSYNQPQMPQMQQTSSNAGIIWIQGESAAKSYLVAPGATVVLFDSESQTIYLKSADATGLPSMRVLDYTIRDQKTNNGVFGTGTGDYATRQDIDDLRAEMERIKARLKGGNKNESSVQRHESRNAAAE